MLRHMIIIICTMIFISCATRYRATYDTYLENSENKSLSFKDDKFYFEFLPVPNGIYFKIENLTKTPAVIVWDRSYFIDPNNNSSKLLNIDILSEEQETVQKTKYESMIPPGAYFARFTTSALNVDKFIMVNQNQKNNYLVINNFTILIQNENVAYQEFLTYGRYWPDIGRIKKSKLDIELNKIKDYVIHNNNMGVGFAIQIDEDVFDYKFDFKFMKVNVFQVRRKEIAVGSDVYIEEFRFIGIMEEKDNWDFNFEEIY